MNIRRNSLNKQLLRKLSSITPSGLSSLVNEKLMFDRIFSLFETVLELLDPSAPILNENDSNGHHTFPV